MERIPTAVVIENIPPSATYKDMVNYTFTASLSALTVPQISRLGVRPYALTFSHLTDQHGCRTAFADFYYEAEASTCICDLDGLAWNGHELRATNQSIPPLAAPKPRVESKIQPQVQMPPYDVFEIATPVRSKTTLSIVVLTEEGISQQPSSQHSNGPMSQYITTRGGQTQWPSKELDFNDLWTLEMFMRILLFMDDLNRDSNLTFPATLTPQQRYTVHLLAQKLGMHHYTTSNGEARSVVVTFQDTPSVRGCLPSEFKRGHV